ncbi:hypothetical protein [Amycolatopsis thailandensis]|uniref:hypothetical protein n=1 Tax=Amycolatopsis thailandensis TaxID=589330 RepID=UPI00362750A7
MPVRRLRGVFDDDLGVCGACGVTRDGHAEGCDPAALTRVTQREADFDRQLAVLLGAASVAGVPAQP